MSGNGTNAQEALKQAAVVIQRLKSRLSDLESAEQARTEPIALIGLGCRMPGGITDARSFYALLTEERDGVVALEPRWAQLGKAPSPDVPRWAGLIDRPDAFDAAFFGISPREAASLDPQQRLLLEVAWEALEDAGLPPLSLNETRTGVFIGSCTADYQHLIQDLPPEQRDAYCTTGNLPSVAAGRLSFTLGLQGPCMLVDTACSSSLVAVHLACQSLRTRECELALAGGVNLILSPETMEGVARTLALSPDGRCRTFDATANGYVRAEGCGIVVLKRLSDAQRDGDRIWALLIGSAVNQDGRSTGLTTPNVLLQQRLLRDALASARVDPSAVGFVECHGTGTSLGDPVELEALRAVLGAPRSDGSRCFLGAVKTNLGHLEAAAGVAGLIKAALVLHHEQIPRNLHFQTLNPRIDLEGTALAVSTKARPWPRGERPRIAGVSGFGMSGTNAHVVLQEAPVRTPPSEPGLGLGPPLNLLTLSARSEESLNEQILRLGERLAREPGLPLGDVCYTASAGRSHFNHRLCLVAESMSGLLKDLETLRSGRAPSSCFKGVLRANQPAPGVAFLFTGQGSQHAGMGRLLRERHPVFRRELERCAEILKRHLDRPLLSLLDAPEEDGAWLRETAYAQPALFALEYALAQLLRSFGLVPAALLGHSLGEYVAACLAEVFSLEDALLLVSERGRLMQAQCAEGEMAAIEATPARVAEALRPYAASASLAAINAPAQVVISGKTDSVRAICAALASEGVRIKRLPVSRAFHSPLIEPMLDSFGRVAARIRYASPRLPLVSNLTGRLFGAAEAVSADYWVRQAREPVRFADGVATLRSQSCGCEIFVEVGPKPQLCGAAAACVPEGTGTFLPCLRKDQDPFRSLGELVAELYVRGVPIDWQGLGRPFAPRRIALPSYPFARAKHWVERPGVELRAAEALPRSERELLALGHRLTERGGLTREESTLLPRLLLLLSRELHAADGTEPAPQQPVPQAPREPAPASPLDLASLPEPEQERRLRELLSVLLGQVLKLDAAQLTESEYLGLDSLMGVELQRGLERSLGIRVPIATFVRHATLGELVGAVLHRLRTGGVQAAPKDPAIPKAGTAAPRYPLREWNDTAADYPRAARVHQLVEAQAALTPDAIAVTAEEGTLCYADLCQRAGRLASGLRQRGIGPGSLVALRVESPLAQVLGALGILMAGGACMPLAPTSAAGSHSLILESSGAAALLLKPRPPAPPAAGEHAPESVSLDDGWVLHGSVRAERSAAPGSAEDPAWVVDSSIPNEERKVLISHRAIVNQLAWRKESFPLGRNDRVLLCSPAGSAAALWEIFAPLTAGTRLVLPRPGASLESDALVGAILAHGITVIQLGPEGLALLLASPRLRECTSLGRIFHLGGELRAEQQEALLDRTEAELYRLYGAAETTLAALFTTCRRGSRPQPSLLGRPIANTQAHILDDTLGAVPLGEPGSLFISGDSLASGYLGDSKPGKEPFVPGPPGSGRLYRTGHRARYLPDGAIERVGDIETAADAPAGLVTLRPGGPGMPLFIVHGSDGSAHWFRNLAAELGPKRAVYGLEHPSLQTESGRVGGVTELARRYLKAVRSVQSEGPYTLSGWSFGGLVAFEMACVLEREGQRASLLLLDTFAPAFLPESSFGERAVLSFLGGRRARAELQELPQGAGDEELLSLALRADLLRSEGDEERLRRRWSLLKANLQAFPGYRPGSFSGPLTLVRARDHQDPILARMIEQDPSCQWRDHATGPLAIVDVPGDHLTMWDLPHARDLARLIEQALDASAQAAIVRAGG